MLIKRRAECCEVAEHAKRMQRQRPARDDKMAVKSAQDTCGKNVLT